MDGVKAHENLAAFFRNAEKAECDGDGWATVTLAGSGEVRMGKCPVCERERLTARLLGDFVPPRFRAEIELPSEVAEWAERGKDAQGLYLAGHVGTGKTHTAWAAAVAWCMAANVYPRTEKYTENWSGSRRQGPNVIFTRMTDLLDDLRPGDDSRQRIRDCQHADLLVIDDLGAEKASEWTQERFYSVIDHRYANCLPLIVTSNLPPSKLADQTGDRAASRLAEMCTVVPMTGTDRRRPAA